MNVLVNNCQLIKPAMGIRRVYNSIEYELLNLNIGEINLQKAIPNNYSGKVTLSVWEQFIHFGNYDVLWSPSHRGPLFAKMHVVTVHDLIPLNKFSGASKSYRTYFYWYTKLLLQKCTKVVAISHSVKTDIIEKLGIDSEKIVVIKNSYQFRPTLSDSDKDIAIANRLADTEFLLFVGTISAHKNLSNLVAAFISLGKFKNRKLVIVGKQTLSSSLGETTNIGDKISSFDSIIHISNANDATLQYLYTNCIGVVVPSFIEGFGLPVVEALNYGKPVICSDIPVFRELFLGMVRAWFDPSDTAQISNAIEHLFATQSVLNGQESLSYNEAIKHTWVEVANQYYKTFSSLST